MPLTTLVAGSTARASDINGNFAVTMLRDTAVTVTVGHTYTASQTFTGGFTTAADVTIGGGTVTTSTPAVNITQTWNAAGVAFTGVKLNITNTTSAAGSVLMDLQVGASTTFAVGKLGHLALGTGTGVLLQNGIRISTLLSGATEQSGISGAITFGSDCTSKANCYYAQVFTTAAAYTVTAAHGFRVLDANLGAGSAITTLYGLYVENQTAGGTNYAIYTNTGLVRFGGAVTVASTLQANSTMSVGAATPSASGAGITFPAAQSASTDANTLDDYEEGTFTPSLTFGGGSTGMTYSVQTGKYTKVGRNVTITISITLSAKGTSTGNASVTGLPFTATSTDVGLPLMPGQNLTAADKTNAYIAAGTPTQLDLYNVPSGGVGSRLTDTAFVNTTQFFVVGTYLAS